jgi:hypothetical protein
MKELAQLNLEIAFIDWATPRGFDMTRNPEDQQFYNVETRAAWLGYEAAHGPDGCKPQGQQLFARIKKSSEYAHQSDKLFPVRVGAAPYDDYFVRGGPGGLYRLRDVNFYVIDGDKQYRLG